MWIVRLALRRPYTFTVMAVAVAAMFLTWVSSKTNSFFEDALFDNWLALGLAHDRLPEAVALGLI